MNFVFKMMDFVSKMMDFVSKMMDFVAAPRSDDAGVIPGVRPAPEAAAGVRPAPEAAAGVRPAPEAAAGIASPWCVALGVHLCGPLSPVRFQ